MANWIKVADPDEIAPGDKLLLEVDGRYIALFNADGKYYAIDDICTHDGGPLADGALYGHEIECPRHGARFDIRTGQAIKMPAFEPVEAYRAEQRADGIYLEMPD